MYISDDDSDSDDSDSDDSDSDSDDSDSDDDPDGGKENPQDLTGDSDGEDPTSDNDFIDLGNKVKLYMNTKHRIVDEKRPTGERRIHRQQHDRFIHDTSHTKHQNYRRNHIRDYRFRLSTKANGRTTNEIKRVTRERSVRRRHKSPSGQCEWLSLGRRETRCHK